MGPKLTPIMVEKDRSFRSFLATILEKNFPNAIFKSYFKKIFKNIKNRLTKFQVLSKLSFYKTSVFKIPKKY